MKNILSQETSPYLLQHANNPVFWQPWNTEVLEKAVAENLLLVVSIGYSACHWCHVMEHESFENEEVATVMNHGFVNIKIDREERPDIDAVYMKAIQIMTGQGGWPLNVVCLPDGRPVWGGTYFKKEHWTETLTELRKMYASQPQKMIDYAEKLHLGIKEISIIENRKNDANFGFDIEIIKNLVAKWSKSFDLDFGGMARTPKFMMPNNYAFLLQYAHEFKDEKVMDFVNLTLTKMAYGGLFDTVDGGFSRYSVDSKWHVPHFEKMSYDNGQLLSLFANAFKKTKNILYQTVVQKTIGFVNRELLDAGGGFYCALDADSLNSAGKLEEGAFYAWTKSDLEQLIGADFALFSIVYNINDFGFWEHGNYVLIQNDSLENIAKSNHISEKLLASKKQQWENILFHEREKRPKPRLDDKCLTAWNAILCLGFVDCYKAFGEASYLETAIKNGQFIKQKMISVDGFLFRNFKNNKVTIKGFLEDYAHVISSFIGLYQVTLNQDWILDAKQLMDYCLEHFWDSESGFFAFNDNSESTFLAKHFETEDNVISASNSVMAKNLLYLNIVFENTHYEKIALNMLQNIVPNIDYPSAYANWLSVYCSLSKSQKELAVVGKEALGYITKINAKYLPNVCLVASKLASEIPFLRDKLLVNKTVFYLCKNKTCGLPTSDFEFVLDEILKN